MKIVPRQHRVQDGSEGAARRPRRLRAIAVLPTLATLGNVLCGFAAIHFCMRALFAAGGGISPMDDTTLHRAFFERVLPSYLAMAGYMIFLAMVFDALDGRLARWARKTTTFGGQLDSLADMVSFGLAPAVLILTLLTRQVEGEWIVAPLGDTFGRGAWLMAGMYVACAALRLARFNVESEPDEHAHRYFKGMPTPGAASVIAALVLLHESVFRLEWVRRQAHVGEVSQFLVKSLPVIALVLGLLMISRIRYLHFGNVILRGKRSVPQVVLLLVAVLAVVLWPEVALALYLTAYAASGPLVAVVRRFRGARGGRRPPADDDSAGADGQSAVRRA